MHFVSSSVRADDLTAIVELRPHLRPAAPRKTDEANDDSSGTAAVAEKRKYVGKSSSQLNSERIAADRRRTTLGLPLYIVITSVLCVQ